MPDAILCIFPLCILGGLFIVGAVVPLFKNKIVPFMRIILISFFSYILARWIFGDYTPRHKRRKTQGL